MSVIRLLNTGAVAERGDYSRRWLALGEPVAISPDSYVMALENRTQYDVETVLRLVKANGEEYECPLPAGHQLDAGPFAKVLLVPRAVELDRYGLTTRVFMEFVRLQKHAPLAV